MPKLEIKTDRKWHDFKAGHEVPKKTLKGVFDWLADAEDNPYFIRHRRHWMHLAQFTRIPGGQPELAGWTGWLHGRLADQGLERRRAVPDRDLPRRR